MKVLLDVPDSAFALLVLAHGAGAGMKHCAMAALAEALNEQGIATLRYEFPYMESGRKRPDSPAVAVARVAEAVALARKKRPKLPLFAGGKSFGGRMTTTAASQGKIDVRGIVCFAFPLHRPKEPSVTRAEHLEAVEIPTLWIQGTRDELSELKLTKKVVKQHSKTLRLHIVEGADHGYAVLKSSGRTNEDVLAEVARAAADFCRARLK